MSFWNKRFGRKGNNLESRVRNIPEEEICVLPEFLVYPGDPIARIMFEGKTKAVCNRKCGYQFLLYTDIADTTPEVRQQQPAFECNETHIYWKSDSPSFVSVSTVKGPSVKSSDLRNWVEAQDQLGLMLGTMTPFLNIPSKMEAGGYRRLDMIDLGQEAAYNKLHGFEEAHAYCHVFYLGNKLYKKFILIAKRDTSSWKTECTIPSETERLQPSELVPPGMVFGPFFPME